MFSSLTGPPPAWRLRVQVDEQAPASDIMPGATATGARELRPVKFTTPDFSHLQLQVDDELLDPAGDGGTWTWAPGFFAGEVVVRLVDPVTARAASYRIDVTPDPTKLGKAMFQSMLHELWHQAPELLLGTEPARRPRGVEADQDDPVLLYGRLRHWGPPFLRALEAMAREPIARLKRERRRVPLHLVRRADRRTAFQLVRTSVFEQEGSTGSPTSLDLVDTPSVEATFDNPANRTMLSLLQLVIQRVRACTRSLEDRTAREQDSETRTTLVRRWPARRAFLRSLELGLRGLRRRPPFADLKHAEVSPAGLTAISSSPLYARAHRTGWLCTRRGFAGSATAEELWLPPTWEIYERWCWVRLRQEFEVGGFVDAPLPSLLPLHDAAWSGVHTDGRKATLLFQPKFSSWSVSGHRGARSLSGELRPDIVLLLGDGGDLRFEVFDAKYRTTRSNVLDAMRSAHIYNDALRYHGRQPDSSVLLVPAGGGAPWLEDVNFRQLHRVGTRVLAPAEFDSG